MAMLVRNSGQAERSSSMACASLHRGARKHRAGFIIASTITFVVTANAWRGVRPAMTALARDAAIGVTFVAIIYVIFTSGLGVALPSFSPFTFHF